MSYKEKMEWALDLCTLVVIGFTGYAVAAIEYGLGG